MVVLFSGTQHLFVISMWLILITFLWAWRLVKSDNFLGQELEQAISGAVYAQGTLGYERRRLLHNGLCSHIYPHWIVVPTSTEDVAAIVNVTNRFHVPISIRSGGHSYTCSSTKQGKFFT
jgi:FAD/FMN-containing dehydrogenase